MWAAAVGHAYHFLSRSSYPGPYWISCELWNLWVGHVPRGCSFLLMPTGLPSIVPLRKVWSSSIQGDYPVETNHFFSVREFLCWWCRWILTCHKIQTVSPNSWQKRKSVLTISLRTQKSTYFLKESHKLCGAACISPWHPDPGGNTYFFKHPPGVLQTLSCLLVHHLSRDQWHQSNRASLEVKHITLRIPEGVWCCSLGCSSLA